MPPPPEEPPLPDEPPGIPPPEEPPPELPPLGIGKPPPEEPPCCWLAHAAKPTARPTINNLRSAGNFMV
jgi:hypothetical protein